MASFYSFWKIVWQKTCAGCIWMWKETKRGCIQFGHLCAVFGRKCAEVWREKLKTPVLRLLRPHWLITLLLVMASVVLLFYAFVIPEANPIVTYIGYAVSAYTLTVVVIKSPAFFKVVRSGLYSNAYSGRYLTDAELRAKVSLYLSCGINIFYAVFKFCAGVYYHSVWFGAVAVYYLIVCLMRFGLIKRYRRNLKSEDEREQRFFGLKAYRFCGVLMFALNIAVTGLVLQLIWKNETYHYPGFLIYAFAGYTFYCFGIAIRNMAKHRKLEKPVLAAAKMLSFACALMSLLALQTAMLTQFGDGQELFAQIMNFCTGTAVCFLIFGLAVWMVCRANRELKEMKEVNE